MAANATAPAAPQTPAPVPQPAPQMSPEQYKQAVDGAMLREIYAPYFFQKLSSLGYAPRNAAEEADALQLAAQLRYEYDQSQAAGSHASPITKAAAKLASLGAPAPTDGELQFAIQQESARLAADPNYAKLAAAFHHTRAAG